MEQRYRCDVGKWTRDTVDEGKWTRDRCWEMEQR
jgi:hypothetical protein